MKTLKQIQEGIVASSDYKLSSSGKRYKAHRRMMEDSNPYAGILEAMGYEIENKKRLKQIAATAKHAQVKGSDTKPLQFTEARDAREYDYEGDMAKSQLRSIIANSQRVHDMLKDNTNMAEWVQSKITLAADYITTVSDYMQSEVKEEVGLDEARGRPKKMSMRHDDESDDSEEHEEHEQDNGVEADQHIHVQLKKAADSDMKPFHVTFKDGKKRPVSQNVAKDILSATERLKPEHRKNVHDEIHNSYDNLMSVHRLIAGK